MKLLLALLGVGLVVGADAADDKKRDVDLTGEWRLNEELSDDPRELMQEMMSKRGEGRGGQAGGAFGGRGGEPGRRGGGGERRRLRFGDPEAMGRLSIEYDAPTLTILDASERGRVINTDGRKVNRDLGEGRLVEVKARWNEGVLEVESKGERGTQRESFSLSGDGTRLSIKSKVQIGRMGKIEIERVYDRAEAPTETTPQ